MPTVYTARLADAFRLPVRGIRYFGVSGNYRSLLLFARAVRDSWFKWLLRRSQRRHMNWERFARVVETRWPLPKPRIAVRIWGS